MTCVEDMIQLRLTECPEGMRKKVESKVVFILLFQFLADEDLGWFIWRSFVLCETSANLQNNCRVFAKRNYNTTKQKPQYL
jgi:hypothetical protein